MSQTSITLRSDKSCTSLSKAKHTATTITVEKKTHSRRYSDINIMMLEGHKQVAPEE